MDLTGMAISVVAYNTPRYLYVTLDALTKVVGIEEFSITVYFDGILPRDIRQAQEEVLSSFNSVVGKFSDTCLGILGNVVRSIRTPIENGASSVLYIEDDHLVRPDVLPPLRDADSDCFLVGLSGYTGEKQCRYFPKGNIIKPEDAQPLLEWIDKKEYIGVPFRQDRPDTPKIDEHYSGHDYIFNAYMQTHNKYTSFLYGFYLAHIGLFGTNFTKYNMPPEILELEDRMFAGEKEQWLDNIVAIINMGDYPTEPNAMNSRLWPRGFAYYGDVVNKTL